jgi:hypothetical protein
MQASQVGTVIARGLAWVAARLVLLVSLGTAGAARTGLACPPAAAGNGRPAADFRAPCSGKSQGDPCAIWLDGQARDGKCARGRGGKLLCLPVALDDFDRQEMTTDSESDPDQNQ